MKNIFFLPTTEPSRLKGSSWIELSSKALNWRYAKHLYITSNEKTVGGDWCIEMRLDDFGGIHDILHRAETDSETKKKIVMSTDPSLISDGVQPVKNGTIKLILENQNQSKLFEVKPFKNEGIVKYKVILLEETKAIDIPIFSQEQLIQSQIDCLQEILDKTSHLSDDGPARYFVLMKIQLLKEKIRK